MDPFAMVRELRSFYDEDIAVAARYFPYKITGYGSQVHMNGRQVKAKIEQNRKTKKDYICLPC